MQSLADTLLHDLENNSLELNTYVGSTTKLDPNSFSGPLKGIISDIIEYTIQPSKLNISYKKGFYNLRIDFNGAIPSSHNLELSKEEMIDFIRTILEDGGSFVDKNLSHYDSSLISM